MYLQYERWFMHSASFLSGAGKGDIGGTPIGQMRNYTTTSMFTTFKGADWFS